MLLQVLKLISPQLVLNSYKAGYQFGYYYYNHQSFFTKSLKGGNLPHILLQKLFYYTVVATLKWNHNQFYITFERLASGD